MKRLVVIICCSILSLAFGTESHPSRQRIIDLDFLLFKGPRANSFQSAVGCGRAKEWMKPEWRQQLKLVHDELGFQHLRCHGILHDDMGVYSEDAQGNPSYKWEQVDAFYDHLLSLGVRPFVELSFMPSALARNRHQTIFRWQAITSPPKSFDRWEMLIRAFATHLTERYGADEVSKWYFEVWNEPDLSNFWSGTQEEYYELYRRSAKAIKEVNASYRVGGPATSGAKWVKEMIQFCDREQLPLDFVSTHGYGRPWVPNVIPDLGSVGRDIQSVRKQIDSSSRPGLELHFTEWNSSWALHELLRDTYVHAPYVLEQIKLAGDAATSMPYWTFTDIFEEDGMPTWAFHGGFGLLTIDGIKKPAYWAYRFVAMLGETELQNSDIHSWACKDKQGGVQVLLFDIAVPRPDFTGGKEKPIVLLAPPLEKNPARIVLRNLKPGNYESKLYRIGPGQNDPYSAYVQMGAPERPSEQQFQHLHAASQGQPVATQPVEIGPDGTWESVFPMHENDVVFVTLTPKS